MMWGGGGKYQAHVLPLFAILNTQNKQKLPMSLQANISTCLVLDKDDEVDDELV